MQIFSSQVRNEVCIPSNKMRCHGKEYVKAGQLKNYLSDQELQMVCGTKFPPTLCSLSAQSREFSLYLQLLEMELNKKVSSGLVPVFAVSNVPSSCILLLSGQ